MPALASCARRCSASCLSITAPTRAPLSAPTAPPMSAPAPALDRCMLPTPAPMAAPPAPPTSAPVPAFVEHPHAVIPNPTATMTLTPRPNCDIPTNFSAAKPDGVGHHHTPKSLRMLHPPQLSPP